MTVTLSSSQEIPTDRFTEKHNVVADSSTLSINIIHCHDEDNSRNKVNTLRLVNEIIKLKELNDLLSLVHLIK